MMKTIAELTLFFQEIDADTSGISLGIDKGDSKLSIFKVNDQYKVLSPLYPGIHTQTFESEQDAVQVFMKSVFFHLDYRGRDHANAMLKYFQENWSMDV